MSCACCSSDDVRIGPRLAPPADVVGGGAVPDELLSEGVEMKTLYDVLGVPCDADNEALNKAYRKAAKSYHPDLNAGDPNASRRFKQVATAIEILRDAKERAAYDRLLDRERQRRRLRQTRIVIANTIAAAAAIVVLAAGYALIGSALSTSTMVSKAEDNAVRAPVATTRQQEIPHAEPTGGGGADRGGLEQALAVAAVSEQLAAVGREAGRSREPEGRQNEAAARSEQDERPQVVEREQPQAELEAAPRPEQTCKRGSPGCERNRPAAVTLREEPKARLSAAIREAPRSAMLARRVMPAPAPCRWNGAGTRGVLQLCD